MFLSITITLTESNNDVLFEMYTTKATTEGRGAAGVIEHQAGG